jgi:ABC-type uncharacterized transport system
MARPPTSPASFSARRRWGIFFSVLVSIAAVAALFVMLNYLGARYFLRFNWSPKTTPKLSPRTLSLLQSITNNIKVVIYYDKSDKNRDTPYAPINALLNEYHLVNPKISVQTVDYVRDSSAARQVQAHYHLNSADDKDLVIFDSGGTNGRTIQVPNKMLWEFGQPHQVISDGQITYSRELKAFHGEEAFDAALLNVINTKPFIACYLVNHHEHDLDSREDTGYWRFCDILAQNNVMAGNLSLAGAGTVPTNCDVLIIAGPTRPIDPGELVKIRQYLMQGGRLLVLFNNFSSISTGHYQTGLETLLTRYDVDAGQDFIRDTNNTTPGGVTLVRDFRTGHPISSSLQGYMLAVLTPRSVRAIPPDRQDSNPPKVTELAFTGTNSLLVRDNTTLPPAGGIPLMVAVLKANARAGLVETEPTRIVVVGDSCCLDNQFLENAPEGAANSEFAALAVNWLLDRQQLMAGVSPRPVLEYRLALTNAQLTSIRWIFLVAMPGGILALGLLVWLRRRR